ncbi:MAG: response regulator [Desulfovibrionaceae bacterium]
MARILLVEDDPLVRAMLVETLMTEGHDITTAEDGAAAVAAYRAAPFDLVITDIVMPGSTGIEAITRLCRDTPKPIIFAISGGGVHMHNDAVLHAAIQAGAARAFAKPVDPDVLTAAIADALATRVA